MPSSTPIVPAFRVYMKIYIGFGHHMRNVEYGVLTACIEMRGWVNFTKTGGPHDEFLEEMNLMEFYDLTRPAFVC